MTIIATPNFETPSYQPDRPGPDGIWALLAHEITPDGIEIHVHGGYEIGVVSVGAKVVNYSNYDLPCSRGDIWLCNAREPHGLTKYGELRQLVFIFRADFLGNEMLGGMPWLAPFSVPPDQRPRLKNVAARKRVLALGELLAQEVENKRQNWQTYARLGILQLLIELAREWRHEDKEPGLIADRPLEIARLMPALNLVHSAPWQRIPVATAARACGLSISQFQRAFRRATGMTFAHFDVWTRLSHAAHWLLNSNRSVQDIAIETGFVDHSHLCRYFIKYYGHTPTEYRSQPQVLPLSQQLPPNVLMSDGHLSV